MVFKSEEAITNLRIIKSEYCFPICCLQFINQIYVILIDIKGNLSIFLEFVDLLLQKDLVDLNYLDLGRVSLLLIIRPTSNY